MDSEDKIHGHLEVMSKCDHDVLLKNEQELKPIYLPLSLLTAITENFSDGLQIGSGGFAVVYKGLLKRGGTVAVKKLLNTICMNDNQFQEEVRCLMRVRHKNIVRFLGYCADTQGRMEDYKGKLVLADERQRLLCFEYLPNGSLEKYINDAFSGLEWNQRYKIIKGICEGLQYLHENNIVHLDLKPANILLNNNMVPKISDFGHSRCFEEMQSRTVTSTLIGSIGYLAPEFFSGEITRKLDIYSLGVIIAEMLTGQKGHSSVENVLQCWRKRFQESYPDTDKLLEQVRVCTMIRISCGNLDPTKRPDIQQITAMLNERSNSGVFPKEQNTEEGRAVGPVMDAFFKDIGFEYLQGRKAFKAKFQDKNCAETLNFRLNIPAKSAPSSGFSSPVRSPQRLSNVDFSSATISIQDTNVWSAQSLWSSDAMGSSPPCDSPDKFAGGQECSPLSSPLRSPFLRSRSPSAPPSPMHPKLFPENHVSRPDGNGSASFQSLLLPPASVSPKQTNASHKLVLKAEMPSVAGQWQKGKLLGTGVFGQVYEATNRHIGALCAMKEFYIIPDDTKPARYMKEVMEEVEQEIKFLSQFKHENIVQYYGSETIEDRFNIYLEYVHPGSIHKYVRQHCGSLTESVICNFTRHILKGLAFLHSQKIMLPVQSRSRPPLPGTAAPRHGTAAPSWRLLLRRLRRRADAGPQASRPTGGPTPSCSPTGAASWSFKWTPRHARALRRRQAPPDGSTTPVTAWKPWGTPQTSPPAWISIWAWSSRRAFASASSPRNIKATNLLVDINGVVKLADFGMAKHLSTTTSNDSFKGATRWIAPEVVRAILDKSAGYDLAVDIWSLGCTIIEVFTGKPPWSDLEGVAAMFKVLHTDPPIPDNLSPEGKDFLRCCFKRNPAERPTASKLLEHSFIQASNHSSSHSAPHSFFRN